MAGIDALKDKFFAAAADLAPDDATFPFQSADNTVTPLVDGNSYFGEIHTEVQSLLAPGGTGKFFYFTSWHLALIAAPATSTTAGRAPTSFPAQFGPLTPFRLDDGTGTAPPLIDELERLAVGGTDVRALAWISPLVVSYKEAALQSGMYSTNAETMLSADALRKRSHMDKKVCLNVLSHPLGTMHLKLVVCGDANGARGFVGGLDFEPRRIDGQRHPGAPTSGWHDVGVRVVGPAVQGLYAWFRQLWNEQIGRPPERFQIGGKEVKTYVDGTPSVPNPPPFPPGGGGSAHVQVLRTAPQMHFALGSTARAPLSGLQRIVSSFRRPAWTSAPNGIFGFAAALEKTIASAERFIYVEDQGFWSHQIMDWLRTALAKRPELKLIMLHRADPTDGFNTYRNMIVAITEHLDAGGVHLDRQVAFYERADRVVIHSKLWIVDDQLVIVGSANAFGRSMYTDGECSLGVINDRDADANFAIRLRSILWAEHCGCYTDAERIPFTDLDAAIKIWVPSWGGARPAPGRLQRVFKHKPIPFTRGAADDEWAELRVDPLGAVEYDQVDPDSRLQY